ncbi:MAG TPA: phytoene synthase [Rhodanobacteraceae bacterium]|nr:phytoene synthase [Rhodanobacteraceae bacterium]
MSDGAFESLVEAWRRARPELALALPYLRGAERQPRLALACLEQQWLETTYGVAENEVAAAKLGWWLEELEAARLGRARHPFTQVLFADDRARSLQMSLWQAPIQAALRLRDTPGGAADLAAQQARDAPLHEALARLETALWFGPGAPAGRAAAASGLGHRLAALARLPEAPHAGAGPLPMNLLARHQLQLGALAQDDPLLAAAVRDQLDALDCAWTRAQKLVGPLSLLRALAERADRRLLRQARRDRQPLRRLSLGPRRAGLGDALAAWRLARAVRGGALDNRRH